jgi:hypothetical protein
MFYFLKYVTAKALQNDDFSLVEEKAKSIEGFDSFVKKAAVILSEQV